MDCFMIARGKRRALRKTCPHEWGHGSLEGYATGERSAPHAAARRRGAVSAARRGQAEGSGQRRTPRPGKGNATYFLPKLRIPPKLWGGPPGPRGSPWTRFSPMKSASSTLRRADGGVGCGPGVRPTINADCAVLGKVCGISQARERSAAYAAARGDAGNQFAAVDRS